MQMYFKTPRAGSLYFSDPATFSGALPLLSFSVDNASPEAGETVTLTIVNGTGPFTAEFDGATIALATQNASAATIAWPNMQAHGSRYNQAADLVLTDTSNGQTHTVQITPAVTAGHDFAVITAMTGIGADDTEVVVGDERVGYVVSGTFEHVDLAVGALMSGAGGTYRYNTFDVSAGVWLGTVDEVIAAPEPISVSNTLDLDWLVLNEVSSALDLDWLVLNDVSNSLDLDWLVLNDVSNTLDLDWLVLNEVSNTLDLMWSVGSGQFVKPMHMMIVLN